MRALLLFPLVVLAACGRVPAPFAPPETPHARYADALRASGLDTLRAGRLWLAASRSALASPEDAALPASRTWTADAGTPQAWVLRLDLRLGERLVLRLRSPDSARVFVDVFRDDSTAAPGRAAVGGVTAGDSLRLTWTPEADARVLVRVQPEVLAGGTVTLHAAAEPTLAFPVASVSDAAIGSGWGDPRDGGARRHEGIDVFAPRGTPALAAAAGRVSRVEETPLGGRVVWLHLDEPPLSLYYAHLDRQSVEPGQRVAAGDTLGVVGTTGNAAGTPPHLHFGIYGRGGAIDPAPFVVGRP